MDGKRLASKTNDEIEELRQERNRLESEKIQLEEENRLEVQCKAYICIHSF